MKPITLQNWAVIINPTADAYTPPELMTSHLVGDVYGHPRFPEGHNITSSAIIGKKGDVIHTKSGSTYVLGKVFPDYELSFPNAKDRLFKTINELKS